MKVMHFQKTAKSLNETYFINKDIFSIAIESLIKEGKIKKTKDNKYYLLK